MFQGRGEPESPETPENCPRSSLGRRRTDASGLPGEAYGVPKPRHRTGHQNEPLRTVPDIGKNHVLGPAEAVRRPGIVREHPRILLRRLSFRRFSAEHVPCVVELERLSDISSFLSTPLRKNGQPDPSLGPAPPSTEASACSLLCDGTASRPSVARRQSTEVACHRHAIA